METFLDTFNGGGTNSFGGGGTGGGYEYNFSAVGGTGSSDLNSNSVLQSSPWGGLGEVGFTSLEQVFRNPRGDLGSGSGNTSSGGMGGDDGAASTGGNTSGGGAPSGGGNSSEIAAVIDAPVSYAIESQSPLTDEESQKLAEDVGQLIEGSPDIAGSDEGSSSTSGDALLSGGSGNSSSTSGFSLRTALDSYFISAEFSNNFSEVPNNTGTDSVLPISGSSFGGGSGDSTGGSPFGGGGMGSGNPPSDDLFSQSPWGRLEVVGIESFSGVFGGGAASGSN